MEKTFCNKDIEVKAKEINVKVLEFKRIKNKYCLDNNIRLIRIPYWNFDKIEEILLKELDV